MHGSNLHPPSSESISNIFPGFFDFLTLFVFVDDHPIKVLGYRFLRFHFHLIFRWIMRALKPPCFSFLSVSNCPFFLFWFYASMQLSTIDRIIHSMSHELVSGMRCEWRSYFGWEGRKEVTGSSFGENEPTQPKRTWTTKEIIYLGSRNSTMPENMPWI